MHIQIDYYVLSSYHTHREYFLVYGMFIFQLAYPKTPPTTLVLHGHVLTQRTPQSIKPE